MLANLLRRQEFHTTSGLDAQLSILARLFGVTLQVQMLHGLAADPSANNALSDGQLNPVLGDPWRAPGSQVWPILHREPLRAITADNADGRSVTVQGWQGRCIGHVMNLMLHRSYGMVEDDSEEPQDSGYETDDSVPSLVSID